MNSIKSLFSINKTPVQKINDQFLEEKGVNLFIKREDLNDPEISGNKLHKLKYNLIEAQNEQHHTLLTFGGAYSNHIYAVAAAGKRFGFRTIGVIRGEEHLPLNYTLNFAKNCGMKLHYLNRKLYRLKHTAEVIDMLQNTFGKFYLIPEGGTNRLAVQGSTEILSSISIDFDLVCVPCGTGGTLAGIINGLDGNKKALGFAVLKGAGFLISNVKLLLEDCNLNHLNNWDINLDYHFGGYAKIDRSLMQFVDDFHNKTSIQLEPIYTGKMLFGIYDLIMKNRMTRYQNILAIHTGGLQGLNGIKNLKI